MVKYEFLVVTKEERNGGRGCYWHEVSRSQWDAAEHLRMQKDSSPQQRIIQSHMSIVPWLRKSVVK